MGKKVSDNSDIEAYIPVLVVPLSPKLSVITEFNHRVFQIEMWKRTYADFIKNNEQPGICYIVSLPASLSSPQDDLQANSVDKGK